MKIFNRQKPFNDKVNFVDNNNVVVGFDIETICCEDVGWFISTKIEDTIKQTPTPDVQDYFFDTNFYIKTSKEDGWQELITVIFRLAKNGSKNKAEELFLHLYNLQNGYYSHGFVFETDSEIIQQGAI